MSEFVIRDIYRLLINRTDCYLTWYDGRWVLRRASLNTTVLAAALRGDFSLGVQAVSGQGRSRWTCLDADSDDQFEPLANLAQMLPAETRLLERSRRGGHLWLFHSAVDWQTAHDRGVALAKQVGLDGIEVYPKYSSVHAVRLIGTKHPKTGAVYPIVEPTTGEILTLEDALSRTTPATLDSSSVNTPLPPIRSTSSPLGSLTDFQELSDLLGQLTQLRIYGPLKASGQCPWHSDHAPSLYVKGRRFHCLACGVWGDAADVVGI